MTLEELLEKRQIEQAQQIARMTAMDAQLAAIQQQNAAPHIGALGRIMLHNQKRNAELQPVLQYEPSPKQTQPNAEPPRVTVQDIFDYHLLKDNCHYCQRPFRPCPVHSP